MNINENLCLVKEKISLSCKNSCRKVSNVKLIAVSKNISVENIKLAIDSGQKDFGENRVQEACLKWQKLKKMYPDLSLHMIGSLQTNKVKQALGIFDVIETVDRLRLARELVKQVGKIKKFPELFVQINIGEEKNKSGCPPAESIDFIRECRELGLKISGVMGIPPVGCDPSPFFALLLNIAKQVCVKKISMGMSSDYELAIYMGATHIRVGTDIFGVRNIVG
jgi:pyridoxal phosphate enzyme (YggS family)